MQAAFTVSDDSGSTIDIAVQSNRDVTLGAVIAELPQCAEVVSEFWSCGGTGVSEGTLIGTASLRAGSIVTMGGMARRDAAPSAIALDVISGPDCGRSFPLSRGAKVLGRGPEADLIIEDPGLSRRHLELQVDAHTVRLRDLGSANGTEINAFLVEPARSVTLSSSDSVKAGNSLLRVRSVMEPPAAVIESGDGLLGVARQEQVPSAWRATTHSLPAPPVANRAKISWLPYLLPLAAAFVMAGVLHDRALLFLGAVSPTAMLVVALIDRRANLLQKRRDRDEYEKAMGAAHARIRSALLEESELRHRVSPDAAAVAAAARVPDYRLWERRRDSVAFLQVRLGLADQPAETSVIEDGVTRSAQVLPEVPAMASLTEGALSITGSSSAVGGVGRWLISQLAVLHSPIDVRFILLLGRSRSDGWRWARWLPALDSVACSSAERRDTAHYVIRLFNQRMAGHTGGAWTGNWSILVIDPASLIAEQPGLVDVIEHGAVVGIAALCIAADGSARAAHCAWTVRFQNEIATTLSLTGPKGVLAPVTAERVSLAFAETIARALAPLRDQRAPLAAPQQTKSLANLLGCDPPTPEAIRATWRADQRRPGDGVPLGHDANGPFTIDLPADGPHLLVAGTTGSGKSELLRSLIASHALYYPPSELSFVLIDYKGGAAFGDCAALPHVAGLVTDLDPHLTRRALIALRAELGRRERLFKQAGVTDLDGYRSTAEQRNLPLSRLVLVVDEFATLVDDLPDFLDGILGVAQRGRSLGMHLVLATQRPAGVLSPAIRANVGLRICLRVPDASDSLDVIGIPDAASFQGDAVGRAIARYSDGRTREFQTAYASGRLQRPLRVSVLDAWNRHRPADHDDTPTELEQISSAVLAAASGMPAVSRPWLDPLPQRMPVSPSPGDTRIVFGLTDEPAKQRRGTLHLDLAEPEAIGLIGSARSGRSTALCTVLGLATAQREPNQLHLYLFDFTGGDLQAFQDSPHCGAYLTAVDPVAVITLVDRLLAESSNRRADRNAVTGQDHDRPAILVALDGWERFLALSNETDAGRSVEGFHRLLRDGPGAGISVLVTGDRHLLAGAIRSALSRTLILPLVDKQDYALGGISRQAVPETTPPGRAIDASTALESQIGVLNNDTSNDVVRGWASGRVADDPSGEGGPRLVVRPLPLVAHPATDSSPAPRGSYLLGIGDDAARPVCWEPSSQGLIIAGPRRSGRTHALLKIAEQAWPTRDLTIAAPPGSALSHWATERGIPVLAPNASPPDLGAEMLLIDDAEQYTGLASGELIRAWLASTTETVVLATSSADLLTDFRGPTAAMRRHRRALLLQPTAADAASFGIDLPWQRTAAVPGRGIFIADDIAGARGYISIQVIV